MSAACRAGAWPTPAVRTLPMMHSSTAAASIPARPTASRTAAAPSWGAWRGFSEPRNFPEGVRAALTMTGVRMSPHDDSSDPAGAEQTDEPCKDHRRGSFQLLVPPGIGGGHLY